PERCSDRPCQREYTSALSINCWIPRLSSPATERPYRAPARFSERRAMRSSSDLLEYYRERAAECEFLAELTDYPEYRELCLYMAKRWLTFIDEDDPKTEEIGHFESASSPPKL